MRLMHVGLAKRSEEASDRLFCDVLGLERVASKVVPAALSVRVFGIDRDHQVLLYRRDAVEVEVFVSPRPYPESQHVGHLCLEVDDAPALYQRCAATGIEVRRIPRQGASELVFLADEDGNLFEIKQAAPTPR